MNNIINIAEVNSAYDKGGIFDIAKQNKSFVHQNVKYTYIASGHMRDVYVSEDNKWVIKIPKKDWLNRDIEQMFNEKLDRYEPPFQHNIDEYESYIQAPEVLQKHIAETKLLPNGAIMQEYVKVVECGGYYREIGRREDGTFVIFDCDCFLDISFKKYPAGYNYKHVFLTLKRFFCSEAVEYAEGLEDIRWKK